MLALLAAAALALASAAAPAPPAFTCTDFSMGAGGGFVEPAILSSGLVGFRPGPNPFAADPFAGASGARPDVPTVSTLVSGYMYRDAAYAVTTLAPNPRPTAKSSQTAPCAMTTGSPPYT